MNIPGQSDSESEIRIDSGNWPRVKLKEIFNAINHSSRAVKIDDNREYTLLSARLYAKGVVKKGTTQGCILKTKKWFITRKGDFLLLKIWARRGSYGFVREDYENGIVSNDYPILQLDRSRADERFVEFALSVPSCWLNLSKGAKGATNRQRVDATEFLNITEIPLPSILVQRRIAAILSVVQEAKEKTEAVIKALKELKKSMMKHLFTYGPVSTADADEVKLEQTEVGRIPRDWRVQTVGQVVECTQYGLSLRGSEEGEYPILRMNSIVEGHLDTTSLQYVDIDSVIARRFRLDSGDLLFNRTNSIDLVGRTALFRLEGEFLFASYLIRIKVKKDVVLPEFLNYYVNWQKTQRRIRMLASRGVSQSNISATKLKSFLIAIPPLADQRIVVEALESIDAAIASAEGLFLAKQEVTNSLLSELMSGRLRVNNLEVPT